ncbi:MAG: peptidase S10 [Armatimonadetes bacterium]|nr:peptidase S10 [Armatimonadota bacterium]MDE2206693.1 peptidase S10 [Armatimonadota bacterium]
MPLLPYVLAALSLAQQGRRPMPAGQAPPPKQTVAAKAETKAETAPPVVTHHTIMLDGAPLHYTATTGMLPLKNDVGVTEAYVFFVAYTRDGEDVTKRPLVFAFNGGPGAASVFVHLGFLGPKRVVTLPNGHFPPPPYGLADNPSTLLTDADLVFLDPVGTGFSRPATPELGPKFWSLDGDIQSVGEFIRMYLTRYDRWSSPLFVLGESYGTTRAAGLSLYLADNGINLNGVVLVSTILKFQGAGDMSFALDFPTECATAWYHHKLAPSLETSVQATVDEAIKWDKAVYEPALMAGDTMSPAQKAAVVAGLQKYLGLRRSFIVDSNLRISMPAFQKELLRSEGKTVGRLDARFTGLDNDNAAPRPEYDPSDAAVEAPFTSAFNSYVRDKLGFRTDAVYDVMGQGVHGWQFPRGGIDVAVRLREAMAKNRYMKVFIGEGYYDMATPFYAVDYTFSHMNLDPSLRANVETHRYESGHMIYLKVSQLQKIIGDLKTFVNSATHEAPKSE